MTTEENSHLSTADDPKAGILLLHDFFGLSDSVLEPSRRTSLRKDSQPWHRTCTTAR